MGRYVMCLLVLLCSSCDKDLGSIHFKKTVESKFSVYSAEIGTFNFKQKYDIDISPKNVNTSFQVISNAHDFIGYDIFAFKSDTLSFDNLIFSSKGAIETNLEFFKTIDTAAIFKLSEEKIKISVLTLGDGSENRSGHFEGVSTYITPLENAPDTIEIVTFLGSIDFKGRVLLFPTRPLDNIHFLEGQYNEANVFSGKIMYNKMVVGSISNDTTNYNYTNSVLKDSLFLSIDNLTKKIVLNIKKNDL